MARRVLITGATGFVGMNVARRFIARGDQVHALVRAARGSWRLPDIENALSVHATEMLDRGALDALLSTVQPHWVVHLAAYGAYSSQVDVTRCVRTNIEASVNLSLIHI